MNLVNNKIQKVLLEADYLFYHVHNKDYGVYACDIFKKCNPKTICFAIPNLQLFFDKVDTNSFQRSLEKLKKSILIESNFKDFIFVCENYKNIRFFNTNYHATHYLLFLLAKSIKYKIINNIMSINLDTYYDTQTQKQFKSIKECVILPGFVGITKEISQITGIQENAHYLDF